MHGAALGVLHGDGQVLAREEAVLELHHVRVDEQGVVQDLALHVLGDFALCIQGPPGVRGPVLAIPGPKSARIDVSLT